MVFLACTYRQGDVFVWADNGALEFTFLKKVVSAYADSPMGANLIAGLNPSDRLDDLENQYRMVEECVRCLENGTRLYFRELLDFSPIFEKVQIAGTVLTPAEILQILNLALCAQSTRQAMRSLVQEYPRLSSLASQLPSFQQLIPLLSGKIDPSGEVLDHASPGLRRVRSEIGVLRQRLLDHLQRILRRQESAEVMQEELITVRNERFVVPVKYDKRKELPGVVHGASSSGATIFVEPLETIDLNNQLVRLKEQAEVEVQKVLLEFTVQIQAQLAELRQALEDLAFLDSLFGRARFLQKFQCVLPRMNRQGTLKIEEGRHPLLEMALKKQGGNIVPISVNLNASRHVLIISGPNTGGKTVVLKTIGLLTLMGLSGIPVPALDADIGFFRQLFADIGDRQSISENLSTFSSHLLNIREMLEKVESPSLVLLDELGTGTDPSEGAALGIAIVERLRGQQITVVATTHHNGLKMYAAQTERVANASVEFDLKTLQPTYRLVHGIPGSSSGIEIARRLGLDEEMVAHARGLIPQEEREIARFSNLLRNQLDLNRKEAERLRQENQALEKQREELKAHYHKQAETLRQQLEQSWQRAAEKFETESRQLLAEIRDKYTTVRARRELERKSAQLRQQVREEISASGISRTAQVEKPQPDSNAREIQVGSRVKVRRFGQEGVITGALRPGEWEVSIGNLKCTVKFGEMELISSAEASPPPKPARISVQMHSPDLVSNELNLVGCKVDEALSQADRFLDKAYLASIPTVRLIHGAGMGILKRALAEWLAQQPLVEKFHTAPPEQGGNAITIVSLKV
jgi:DNA mismatch repair protein MutS2